MALVCVGSLRGAPGATTLAVLLAGAWPRRVVLVEADPDGGVLATRCGLGREPGLAGLAATLRGRAAPAEVMWDHAQRLHGGVAAVVAHESSDVTSATLAAVGERLASWCASLEGVDVIADVGRLRAGSPALGMLPPAAAVLAVAHPKPDELYALLPRLRAVTTSDARRVAGVVLVGERPHRSDEVRDVLGVPVVGVVADDPKAADVLWEGGSVRRLQLSALARSVRSLAEGIAPDLAPATSGDAGVSPPAHARRRRPAKPPLPARQVVAGARTPRLSPGRRGDGNGPEDAR